MTETYDNWINGAFVAPTVGLWNHEQLRARIRFMTITTPTSSAETYRPPFQIDGVGTPAATVSALGKDEPDLTEHLGRGRRA